MHSCSVFDSKILFSHMRLFARICPIFNRSIRVITLTDSKSKLFSRSLVSRAFSRQFYSSVPMSSASVDSPDEEVVIALGSNVGDRIIKLNEALQLMRKSGIKIQRHACLYETEPAYVTDQPLFLNSAVRGTTKLQPVELLKVLKQIEKQLGRTNGIRYGPRAIDLDILLYGRHKVESEILTIPHERMWERPFVLAPLVDLLGTDSNDEIEAIWHSFSSCKGGIFEQWRKAGGEASIGKEGLRRVLPVGNRLWDLSKKTHIMGIINLTPDSFSDGGQFQEVESAVSLARELISDGADIIDIGAQSTRPFAHRISAEEELERLVPVLDAVLRIPEIDEKLVSIDTFYAKVANEALKKGVHIINDISGGHLDPDILAVVRDHQVPFVIMHMRGDPQSMQNKENMQYENICEEVALELYARITEAEVSGIPLWRIIIDPGIGFAKRGEHNLEILMNLASIRKELAKRSLAASHSPLLVGPSRKRFLGEICGRDDPVERDAATIAAVSAGILGGANLVRVHNVRDNLDAARICDALLKMRREGYLIHGALSSI